jgi:membrane-associated phospholipid phosphatase
VPWIRLQIPVLLISVLGALALRIDVPLARWARSLEGDRNTLRELLENLEPFGHATGVIAIAIVIFRLDHRRRMQVVPRVLLAAFGAGLAANAIKLCIHRDRPWLLTADVVDSLDTFRGLFPGLSAASAGQSFPSAHAASAMGLAVALAHYYPPIGAICYALAGATAMSRVVAGSHYASDALAGLALGLLIGRALFAHWSAANIGSGGNARQGGRRRIRLSGWQQPLAAQREDLVGE